MTPAIALLKKAHAEYRLHSYSHTPTATAYGLEAVQKLGLDPAQVFKTLLVVGFVSFVLLSNPQALANATLFSFISSFAAVLPARRCRSLRVEAQAMLILSGAYAGFLPEHFARPGGESGDLEHLKPGRLRLLSAFEIITRRGGRDAADPARLPRRTDAWMTPNKSTVHPQ